MFLFLIYHSQVVSHPFFSGLLDVDCASNGREELFSEEFGSGRNAGIDERHLHGQNGNADGKSNDGLQLLVRQPYCEYARRWQSTTRRACRAIADVYGPTARGRLVQSSRIQGRPGRYYTA